MLPFGSVAFLWFGVVLVLVGANQDGFAADLGLGWAQMGTLQGAILMGGGLGVLVTGHAFDRMARRPLLVLSLALTGLALTSVRQGMSYAHAVASVAAIGVGMGAYETVLNAAFAERYEARAGRWLSIGHAFATLGAILCPILAAWFAARGHWTRGFHAIGAAHLALAAIAAFVPLPAHRVRSAADAARPVLTVAFAPLLCLSFAYIGIESAMTVFALPYADGALGLSEERGRAAISALWGGLLIGRLAVALLRRPLDAGVVATAGIASAALIGAGAALGVEWIELYFGAVGVGLGCVFPLLISLAGQGFPYARGAAVGYAVGIGSVGGFVVPTLTGVVGDLIGARAAMGSLALWALVIAAAAALLQARGAARKGGRAPA